MSAVKCEYAIISHGGMFGHPTQNVLDRLVESGCSRIFETQKDGNIKVSVFGSGVLSIDAQNNDDKDVNNEAMRLNLFMTRLYYPNCNEKRFII